MTQAEFQELSKSGLTLKPTLIMGLFEFCLQIILLLAGFYLSLQSIFLWIPGQILLGICFWRSFGVMHACGHHAFSSSKILDDLIGMIMSVFCFIPYYAWKFIHHDHHKWTGWIDRDPTMRNLLKKKDEKTLKLLNIAWWSWIPVISIHYIATVFFRTSLHEKKKLAVGMSIALILVVHVTAISTLGLIYIKLFGLAGFIYLNIGDLSLLTQHVHIPMDHSEGKNIVPKKYYEQADFSHTMILPAFVARWIVMNFNHHALHHILPKVPYYRTGEIEYSGKHTHHWKEWIFKAKSSRASELIYPS